MSATASTGNLLQVNGTSLYVIKEGQGEPVVFMHGFGLDHRMWKKQMDALHDRFTVIGYDLRGFGRSALPDEQAPYTHESDYLALLDHFALGSAHIVALSMGGRMALRCALRYPRAVSSLVLMDAALDGYSWSVSWQQAWSDIVHAARHDEMDKALELWKNHSLFVHANAREDVAYELNEMIGAYTGWHWVHKDPALVPRPPAINRLEQITIPALIMAGALDIPDFRTIANRLSQEMPLARQLIVPEAGHMVNMESPDFVNRAILDFLNGVRKKK